MRMHFLDFLAKLKIRFDRGRGYLVLYTFITITFLVVDRLKGYGITSDIILSLGKHGTTKLTLIIITVAFAGIILLGHIDIKGKFFQREMETLAWLNPVTKYTFKRYDEMDEKLDLLLKKIEEIESRLKEIERKDNHD